MSDPRAGQPAQPSDLVDVAHLVTAYFTGRTRPGRPRPAGRLRHVRAPRLEPRSAPSTRPTSSPPRRRSASTGPPRAPTGRCSSAATPTPCPSRRGSARSRCSPPTTSPCSSTRRPLHADPGRVARHPAGQRRTHDGTGLADGIVVTPVAQPARRRRVQVQPAPRRPGRHRRDRLDRPAGQRAARRRAGAASSGCRSPPPGPRRSPYDFLGTYVDDLPNVRRHRRRPRRRRAHRRRPARRRERRLLGGDRRAPPPRPDRRQPARRPDVALHDAGLGRQDPHGLLVAGRHGVAHRQAGRRSPSPPATTPTADRHGIVTPDAA